MNLQKNIKSYRTALLLLTLSFCIYACKKTDDPTNQEGPAIVKLNLLGVQSNSEGLATGNEAKSARLSSVNKTAGQTGRSKGIQMVTVPFDKKLSLTATLTPADIPVTSGTQSAHKVMASPNTLRAPDLNAPTALADDVLYKVLVYDSTGVLLNGKDYKYGEDTVDGFTLDAGKEYTFVVVSLNSTSEVPDVLNGPLPNSGRIINENRDLLFFKKTIRLTHGENNLDVILKHQFSQITTTINLGTGITGDLDALGQTTITPTRSVASLYFDNGLVSYGFANPAGTLVNFPAIGSGIKSITSAPTLVISEATTEGALTISSITIGGVTKENLVFDGLTIEPGVRYNLNIGFQSPCTEVVTVDGAFDFDVADGGDAPSKTIQAPGADFGFTFDVTSLDNSFNLTINGTSLIGHATSSSHELQFQSGETEYPQNVQFADGALWGVGDVPNIYDLSGTETKPIIRVVIDANGNVSLYGVKSDSGELELLELTGGFFLNNITWNKSAQNEVTVSQVVTGVTTMIGNGYGLKTVPCELP